MATIDQLELDVFTMYAMRTWRSEQINQQLRLNEAAAVATQLQIVEIFPRMTELDLLLGILPMYAPFAYFYAPKPVLRRTVRRGPFNFFRAAPSFGSVSRHDDEIEMLEGEHCDSDDEKRERSFLLGCVKMIKKINKWKAEIIGNLGRGLQG